LRSSIVNTAIILNEWDELDLSAPGRVWRGLWGSPSPSVLIRSDRETDHVQVWIVFVGSQRLVKPEQSIRDDPVSERAQYVLREVGDLE
jgi:hypothetical protein